VSTALEQLPARLTFQNLHVVRQCGLGEVQQLRGFGDGARFQNSGQLEQMPRIHRFSFV
jgi:hypothetical protein